MSILMPQLLLYKYKNLHQARKYLSNAYKKWEIIRISNWIYITKEYKYEELCTVANMLVKNSYISLHTILWNEWVLIEIVKPNLITSITTTRKTQKYKIKMPKWEPLIFSYNYISRKLFWLPNGINPLFATYYVATKEKALVDYLHFSTLKRKFKDDNDIKEWLKSLRLNLWEMNWNLFLSYLPHIKSFWVHYKKLYNILNILYKERDYIDFYSLKF